MEAAHLPNALHVRSASPVNPLSLLLGVYHPHGPLRFIQSSGRRLCDVITHDACLLWLVSEHLTSLAADAKLSGWSTVPSRITSKNGDLIEGYSTLIVAGRCGLIHTSQCRTEERQRVGTAGVRYQARVGYHFDLASWDGSDFFVPARTGLVFVSEAVRSALEGNVSNAEFTPLDEAECMII
jgi:hypothetical protein